MTNITSQLLPSANPSGSDLSNALSLDGPNPLNTFNDLVASVLSFSGATATASLSNHQFIQANLPCASCGMFSVLTYLLGVYVKYLPEQNGGFEISFGKEGSYFDPNRGENWWRYYFEEVKPNTEVVATPIKQFDPFEYGDLAHFAESSITRAQAYEIVDKHFKVLPEIRKEVDDFAAKNFAGQGKIISVHFRGTDKACASGCEAPRIGYEEILNEIQEYIDKESLQQFKIFVASDEQTFIDAIQKKFPDKVVTSNAHRSTTDTPLHLDSTRDPYQTGKEALIDSLLLSRGDVLFRTSSNLSLWSTYFNPNIPVFPLSERHAKISTPPDPLRFEINPIVSSSLSGGTGNQMFMIATATAHALDIGGTAKFQNVPLDHVGVSPIFSRVERFTDSQQQPNIEILEQNFQYVDLPKKLYRSSHLNGFFFSWKYFHHRRKEILELFKPTPEIQHHLETKYKDLLKQDTVAVHVRRGDYKTFGGADEKRLLCVLTDDTEYYDKAMKYFDKENQHFVIFSDDIEYVKNMPAFKDLKHVTFIEGQQAHEDLYLISMCKHQIMANSTFSWWAAYLRKHPNAKVTYPINAFWGPATVKYYKDGGAPGSWGHRDSLLQSAFHPNGFCVAGPDYFPMDHWIKVD